MYKVESPKGSQYEVKSKAKADQLVNEKGFKLISGKVEKKPAQKPAPKKAEKKPVEKKPASKE